MARRASGGKRLRPGLRLAAGLVLVAGMTAVWQVVTWPDVGRLARERPETTAFIERARRQGASVEWRWVAYARISPHLKQAVLVAEDIGFFDHQGFAVEEMKLALKQALLAGRAPRGASTITQQLAKNLWLSPSRTPWRKLEEALLTRQLERQLDKRRILELYLNVVEFGPGVYGAEAAARHYFRRSAASLDPHQAALLAAGLPRPKSWNPASESRAYRRRVKLVEDRMARAAWLRKLI